MVERSEKEERKIGEIDSVRKVNYREMLGVNQSSVDQSNDNVEQKGDANMN